MHRSNLERLRPSFNKNLQTEEYKSSKTIQNVKHLHNPQILIFTRLPLIHFTFPFPLGSFFVSIEEGRWPHLAAYRSGPI